MRLWLAAGVGKLGLWGWQGAGEQPSEGAGGSTVRGFFPGFSLSGPTDFCCGVAVVQAVDPLVLGPRIPISAMNTPPLTTQGPHQVQVTPIHCQYTLKVLEASPGTLLLATADSKLGAASLFLTAALPDPTSPLLPRALLFRSDSRRCALSPQRGGCLLLPRDL